MPAGFWGGNIQNYSLDFNDIYYYVKPVAEQGKTWDEVPAEIQRTFDKLGIPEAERKFLSGVEAQYDSEVVYHNIREDLEKLGVIFTDTDSALREHPDLVKQYFGTIIPPNDNKFAALNSAVWSGGSFIYVPAGVKVPMPLQAYFRINTENMGQFERTLIIAEEGSDIHYVEGCTAPFTHRGRGMVVDDAVGVGAVVSRAVEGGDVGLPLAADEYLVGGMPVIADAGCPRGRPGEE
jgi:Fe-S cluster assembly protein SufB